MATTLFATAVCFSALCSWIAARRFQTRLMSTMMIGSRAAFLAMIGAYIVLSVANSLTTDVTAPGTGKLTWFEGLILYLVLYGGVAMILGVGTGSVCHMLNRRNHRVAGKTGSRHPVLAFVVAVLLGASLFGVRWVVRGNADPFTGSWPVYLQLGSLGSALSWGVLSRRPLIAALGVYSGGVAFMLVDGTAEYPTSSLIALTIHGLLPALIGALCAMGINRKRPHAVRVRHD